MIKYLPIVAYCSLYCISTMAIYASGIFNESGSNVIKGWSGVDWIIFFTGMMAATTPTMLAFFSTKFAKTIDKLQNGGNGNTNVWRKEEISIGSPAGSSSVVATTTIKEPPKTT